MSLADELNWRPATELARLVRSKSRKINDHGFDLAKIGDVVVVRQVNHQRIDHHGLQFTAAFHATLVQ